MKTVKKHVQKSDNARRIIMDSLDRTPLLPFETDKGFTLSPVGDSGSLFLV